MLLVEQDVTLPDTIHEDWDVAARGDVEHLHTSLLGGEPQASPPAVAASFHVTGRPSETGSSRICGITSDAASPTQRGAASCQAPCSRSAPSTYTSACRSPGGCDTPATCQCCPSTA